MPVTPGGVRSLVFASCSNTAKAHAPLHDQVKYDVKNGVVTLTGDVNSQTARTAAQQIAARVPNIEQVVNELQVKNKE